MILKRKASGLWRGGIRTGTGIIVSGSTNSGLVEFPFASGFGDKKVTNPEELLASAHVASFAITLAQELERLGLDAPLIQAEAVLSLELFESGWTVVGIHLRVFASLPESERWTFVTSARQAARTCLTARLFRAKISVDAQLREEEMLANAG